MMLPFNLRPTVGTYLYAAYPFGILENPRLPATMLEWNIQLAFQPAGLEQYGHHLVFFPALNFDAYTAFGLFRQTTLVAGRATSATLIHLPTMVRRMLRDGSYALVYADYHHLPGTREFGTSHFRHDLLIYGYDDAAKTFHGALYGVGRNLSSIAFSDEQLQAGFASEAARGRDCAAYCRGDCLAGFAPTPSARRARLLDLAGIQAQIECYLASANIFVAGEVNVRSTVAVSSSPKAAKRDQVYYGRSIYSALSAYFGRFQGHASFRYDLRITRLLFEHKKLMGVRLKRLAEDGWAALNKLALKWREIEQLAFFVHLCAIASANRKETRSLSRLRIELERIEQLEASLLEGVLGVDLRSRFARRPGCRATQS